MKLLWLDLETTGLDPARGWILEVGAIFTDRTPWLQNDGDGAIRRSAVLPFNLDEHPLDANVREMHARSGLRDECLEAFTRVLKPSSATIGRFGVPPEYSESVRSVEDMLLDNLGPAIDGAEAPYLAGCSVHFDLAWVRTHMPRFAQRLSYRVYDVSAVVLFCRSIGMPKPEESKDKPHRALPDLDRSIALARRCAEWLDAVGVSLVDPGLRRPLHEKGVGKTE